MSYFSTVVPFNNLLFKDLNIVTTGDLVAACLVTFFVTILYEGMKSFKVYVDLRLKENPFAGIHYRHSQDLGVSPDISCITSTSDNNILLSSLQFPATVQQIRNKKLMLHALSTLIMMINLIMGYVIMLIVMTFDTWLTIAVVAGSALGYFVCNAIGQVVQLRLQSRQPFAFDIIADHHEVPQMQQTGSNQICLAETVPRR